MAVRASSRFAFFCIMLMSASARAEDSADRMQRLTSVIAVSSYGSISRAQATLVLLCDKPGLAKALEQPKAKALLDLMEQKKIVWANGDTPELLYVLTTAMSMSYVQGLSMVASDATNTGKTIKTVICQSAATDADSMLSAK